MGLCSPMLELCWPSWSYVGPSQGYVGPSRGYVGPSWGYVGPSWGSSWANLGLWWANLDPQLEPQDRKKKKATKCCKTQCFLGRGGGTLASRCVTPIMALCSPMFDQFALYWHYVGPCWPYLGLCWHYVGLILAHVGPKVALCWPMLALCSVGLWLTGPRSGRGRVEVDRRSTRDRSASSHVTSVSRRPPY